MRLRPPTLFGSATTVLAATCAAVRLAKDGSLGFLRRLVSHTALGPFRRSTKISSHFLVKCASFRRRPSPRLWALEVALCSMEVLFRHLGLRLIQAAVATLSRLRLRLLIAFGSTTVTWVVWPAVGAYGGETSTGSTAQRAAPPARPFGASTPARRSQSMSQWMMSQSPLLSFRALVSRWRVLRALSLRALSMLPAM